MTDRLGQDRPVPVFVFDAGYDRIALTDALSEVRTGTVVRDAVDEDWRSLVRAMRG